MNYFIVGGAEVLRSTLTKRLLAEKRCEKIAPYLLNVEYRSNDKGDLFNSDMCQLNW